MKWYCVCTCGLFVFQIRFQFCRIARLISLWLYPFCLKTCLRCYSSSLRLSASHSLRARRTSALGGAKTWRGVKISARVGFLCIVWPSVPSSLLVTRTFKKDKAPFCSIFIVNLMFSWIPFRCFWNSCNTRFPCGHTTKVLSTYLYQQIGLCIAVLMAVCSRCSMFCHYRRQRGSYGHSVLLSEKKIHHKENTCLLVLVC